MPRNRSVNHVRQRSTTTASRPTGRLAQPAAADQLLQRLSRQGADSLSGGEVVQLQRLVGNRTVQRALEAGRTIQRNDDPPGNAPPPPGLPPAPGLVPATPALKWNERPEYKRKKALDEAFSAHKEKLFASPAEGTFQYVAQYLYASVEADADKRQAFDACYDAVADTAGDFQVQERTLDDDARQRMLAAMIPAALKKYGGSEAPQLLARDIAAQAGGTSDDSLKPQIHETGDDRGSLPEAVALGFHGTDGDPGAVVKSSAEGGWGGLQKTQNVPFFRTRYALDAAWNPLDQVLQQGEFYRMGENWDNELLSTVSIATKATPAIKFPFPRGNSDTAKTWLYATVVEKAYPTFKIQKTQFPEVAVNSVDPEDFIGYQVFEKNYDPALIKSVNQRHGLGFSEAKFGAKSNENFAYFTSAFVPSAMFQRKWGKEGERVAEKAAAQIKEELGVDGGIYSELTVSKFG